VRIVLNVLSRGLETAQLAHEIFDASLHFFGGLRKVVLLAKVVPQYSGNIGRVGHQLDRPAR
jgi:hypothetical protein